MNFTFGVEIIADRSYTSRKVPGTTKILNIAIYADIKAYHETHNQLSSSNPLKLKDQTEINASTANLFRWKTTVIIY